MNNWSSSSLLLLKLSPAKEKSLKRYKNELFQYGIIKNWFEKNAIIGETGVNEAI